MLEHHVRLTRAGDVDYVAANMRAEDAAEVFAVSGRGPLAALANAVDCSIEPLTFAPDGVPAAIFGVVPNPCDAGFTAAPWLLGTDEFPRHARRIARFGPAFLALLERDHDHLINFIDKRNTVHIGWIKRLGFTVTREVSEFGFERRPFLQFERHSHV